MPRTKIDIAFPKLGLSISNKNLNATASRAETICKNMILKGRKTGFKYPNLPNRSSAPGEAPAHQNSDGKGGPRPLVSTIGHTKTRITSKTKTFSLYSRSPYARVLEFGGGKNNIAERPFLRPSLEKAVENYKNKNFEVRDFVNSKTGKTTK